jgi:putative heme-binding domain-containing protein
MHAMYALAGLEALDESILLRGLNDDHSQVRTHAVRLSERLGHWPARIRERLAAMIDDELPVRYQLAFTSGLMPADAARNNALMRLARRDGENRWMQFALLVSMSGEGADQLLDELARDASLRSSKPGREIITGLATTIGARGAALSPAVDAALGQDAALGGLVARGYAEGMLRTGRSLKQVARSGEQKNLARLLEQQVAAARKLAVDEKRSVSTRVRAIQLLAIEPFAASRDELTGLLDQRQPQDVQHAVLTALESFHDPGVARLLLDAWRALGPRTRVAAAEALLARPERITALLDAIESGSFDPRELEVPRVQLLLNSSDPVIRKRAIKLLGSLKPGRRQDVVDAYRGVLKLAGDAGRGKQLFQKTCAACHRAERFGYEIGPNLVTVKNRGAEFILFNVLDPSREVNPQYVNYVVITDDGRTMTGMIAEESASSVTLRRGEGATDTVLRANIEEIQSTSLSLMPEGLEKQLDPQALADVIAYVLSL